MVLKIKCCYLSILYYFFTLFFSPGLDKPRLVWRYVVLHILGSYCLFLISLFMISHTSCHYLGAVMCVVINNLFYSAVWCVLQRLAPGRLLQKEQSDPVKIHCCLKHIPELVWKNIRNHAIDMNQIMNQSIGCTRSKVCVCVCVCERFSFRDLNKKASSVKNSKAKIELLGSYDPEKQLIIQDPYYVSVHTCTQQDQPQSLVVYCQILNQSSNRPKIKFMWSLRAHVTLTIPAQSDSSC